MRLHGYFTDGAVLCGGKNAYVFGFAACGENIAGELVGAKTLRAHTVADENGRFRLDFGSVESGYDIYTLTVKGAQEEIVCNDIVFGEVYYASGQSNMEYALAALEKCDELLAKYASRHLRFVNVRFGSVRQEDGVFRGDGKECDDISGTQWHATDEERSVATQCSGIAFVFAGEMRSKLDCPVGIVNVSVGGCGIENWLPPSVIENDPQLSYYKFALERKNGRLAAGCIYADGLKPFYGFSFSGIVWYQGESSAWDRKNAWAYRYALPQLVNIFRGAFGHLPLLAIHIAIEKYDKFGVNIVNEGINETASVFPDMAVCPIFDLPHRYFHHDGNEIWHSIHPVSKTEAGVRAARIYYNRFIKRNGKECARYLSCARVGNKLEVKFAGVKNGLSAKRKIVGFTVAGRDKKYFLAQAEITDKDTVTVFSPYVSEPQYVCYGFYLYNNACNLKANGLPVLPFRSDVEYGSEDTFIEPPAYTDIVSRVAMETAFNSDNGGMRYVPSWCVGKLYGGKKSKITYGEEYVTLDYKKDERGYYFYGISPQINIAYGENMFARYEYVTLEVESSADIFFTGCTVRTSDGEQFTFGAVDGEEVSHRKAVKKMQRERLTVPLGSAFQYTGVTIPVSPQMRKKICVVQFTFRDFGKEEGRIKIFSVDFHD